MAVTTMEILGGEGGFYPLLPLTRQTRDALARYCEIRWPNGRRKAVAGEWGLSMDEARAVCEADASARILDKIWKHPNGGWAVLLPVMGAVIGQTADQFLEHERRRHAEHAARLRGLARDFRAGRAVPPDRPDRASAEAGRRRGDRHG